MVESRTYHPAECAVIWKTTDTWGVLSNMASGFPLQVNGHSILSSEALYQACRFPQRPDLQRMVLDQPRPMAAKQVTMSHRDHTRKDWDQVRVAIMRWVLRVKTIQQVNARLRLFETTGQLIVERSQRDDFWGAKMVDGMLQGANVLGRLWMEVRAIRDLSGALLPPPIPGFDLLGRPIRLVE